MDNLNGQIAVVTGSSRGIGKGTAIALGEKGCTVYVTGRSTGDGERTIDTTARQVTEAGGEGRAIQCDHGDDDQIEALFRQIGEEAGRIDILVNNVYKIPDPPAWGGGYWDHPIQVWDDQVGIGLRAHYVASWHAAKMMVVQGSGWIIFGSSFGANCYMHGPGYGAQKAGIDKFAADMQHDFDGTGVNAVSIWMGPLKTERALKAAEVHPEQYADIMAVAENPEYTGHLIHALASRAEGAGYGGQTVIGAELGKSLGISDNGVYPPSHREMLGSPPQRSAAVIY